MSVSSAYKISPTQKPKCNGLTDNLNTVYPFPPSPLPATPDHKQSLWGYKKLMCNNSNLDLVNAYAKLGQIPLICSQDIEQN